jgi:hypothetical protein
MRNHELERLQRLSALGIDRDDLNNETIASLQTPPQGDYVIRAALQTDKGPIGIIGINHENLRRIKAGLPLDIDIKGITPPGTRINRVIVHYAHTYMDVVDDMEKGGIPIPDTLRKEAEKMDEQLKSEKAEKHG